MPLLKLEMNYGDVIYKNDMGLSEFLELTDKFMIFLSLEAFK